MKKPWKCLLGLHKWEYVRADKEKVSDVYYGTPEVVVGLKGQTGREYPSRTRHETESEMVRYFDCAVCGETKRVLDSTVTSTYETRWGDIVWDSAK